MSLNGDLGAGKTHLTKGIAAGLGVDDYITSPTFTIVNEYIGRLPFIILTYTELRIYMRCTR
ncbi:tRNA (adenosine(37)-N6)-threonylcarbamoyltransferase complex ATPase subunit type 1 TsaE [Caloramator sp. mosi_1]|uniref:tRNA (adenosine(37)-N6)-threonylcarbamoyltransferase complex ATPase subunit type 1 TsaE n=1 Tax=Caloramator sp. mosi_1 TaxID=3023090 RepID=UPI003081C019